MNISDRINAIRGDLHAPVPRLKSALQHLDALETALPKLEAPKPADVAETTVVVGLDLGGAKVVTKPQPGPRLDKN